MVLIFVMFHCDNCTGLHAVHRCSLRPCWSIVRRVILWDILDITIIYCHCVFNIFYHSICAHFAAWQLLNCWWSVSSHLLISVSRLLAVLSGNSGFACCFFFDCSQICCLHLFRATTPQALYNSPIFLSRPTHVAVSHVGAARETVQYKKLVTHSVHLCQQLLPTNSI